MEESKNQQNTNNEDIKNQQIVEEVEKIRRKEKFLKVITFILSSIIIISLIIVYYLYRNYKKMSRVMEEVVTNIEENISQNNSIEEITKNAQSVISSSISLESSSLSKIGGFSKDLIEAANRPETAKNVEELVDEYYNDPAINKFIEKFRNDPDMKDIFEAPQKDRPMMMFKKMNDPKFMQKITKEFLSDPQLIQSFMKMGTDPRIQQMMKQTSKDRTLKIPVESQKKSNQ